MAEPHGQTQPRTRDFLRPFGSCYSNLPQSRERGYSPGRFSFNVVGGRCEHCDGDGVMKIEMHFLPDVFVACEHCKGSRYNAETLEILHKGKSIHDVLSLTAEDGLKFFADIPNIARKLKTLCDVGLGYIKLRAISNNVIWRRGAKSKVIVRIIKKNWWRGFLCFG